MSKRKVDEINYASAAAKGDKSDEDEGSSSGAAAASKASKNDEDEGYQGPFFDDTYPGTYASVEDLIREVYRQEQERPQFSKRIFGKNVGFACFKDWSIAGNPHNKDLHRYLKLAKVAASSSDLWSEDPIIVTHDLLAEFRAEVMAMKPKKRKKWKGYAFERAPQWSAKGYYTRPQKTKVKYDAKTDTFLNWSIKHQKWLTLSTMEMDTSRMFPNDFKDLAKYVGATISNVLFADDKQAASEFFDFFSTEVETWRESCRLMIQQKKKALKTMKVKPTRTTEDNHVFLSNLTPTKSSSQTPERPKCKWCDSLYCEGSFESRQRLHPSAKMWEDYGETEMNRLKWQHECGSKQPGGKALTEEEYEEMTSKSGVESFTKKEMRMAKSDTKSSGGKHKKQRTK